MMENDDNLIKSFLLANKKEIADNGFSRRVVRRLPQRAKWLSDILTVVCTVICCILFFLSNGFSIFLEIINENITAQSYQLLSNINFQSLVIITIVLTIIGVQRVESFK